MSGRCFLGCAVLFSFLACGRLAAVSSQDSSSKQPTELNGGYCLLHHLGQEESSVAMLFIIKDAPENIGAFREANLPDR